MKKEDYQNALKILKSVQEQKEASNDALDAFGNNYEKVVVYCPQCESANVYGKKAPFLGQATKCVFGL